jgi:hypothetical protein
MFRAFGFGKELYPDVEQETTPIMAWNMLLAQAKKFKIDKVELMAAFRACGIVKAGELTEEDKSVFIDRFEDLWKALSEYVTVKNQEAIPTNIPTGKTSLGKEKKAK